MKAAIQADRPLHRPLLLVVYCSSNQAISLQFGASNGGFGMRCRRILPNFRSLEAVGGSFESLCSGGSTIASLALVGSIEKE